MAEWLWCFLRNPRVPGSNPVRPMLLIYSLFHFFNLSQFKFFFGFGSQSGQCAQVTKSLSRPPRASLALVPTYPTVCLTLYSLTGHVLSGIRITGDANLPTRMQSGSIGIRTPDPQLEVQRLNHCAIPHSIPSILLL